MSPLVFSYIDPEETRTIRRKRRFRIKIAALLLVPGLLLAGCQGRQWKEEDQAFSAYTEKVFSQEVASNTVSLHYTLKNPEEYGIRNVPVTFGGFLTDGEAVLASIENMSEALSDFSYNELSVENRLTYDVMEYYLSMLEEDTRYLLYEEPLGSVSGIQTQLPVLLSEYQFYGEEDVKTYIELLKTTPEYFDSLIAFEKEKSKEGLFMADYAADTVIQQCNAFLEMGESNYLISTFVDRIEELDELTEKEKSDYIQKNAMAVSYTHLDVYKRQAVLCAATPIYRSLWPSPYGWQRSRTYP